MIVLTAILKKIDWSVGNIPDVMSITESPMDHIQIDDVGKLPNSRLGNRYIILDRHFL